MSSWYLQRCQSGRVILCSECMHVVSFCCSLFHVCKDVISNASLFSRILSVSILRAT